MPTPCSSMVSNVCLGSHSETLSKAFWPAKTSIQFIFLLPLYAFSTTASKTNCEAGHISIPIPSPSMNGIVGLSVSKDSLVLLIALLSSFLSKFSAITLRPLLLFQFLLDYLQLLHLHLLKPPSLL